jgi:hypothetical protein
MDLVMMLLRTGLVVIAGTFLATLVFHALVIGGIVTFYLLKHN